jgi:hypothetical protein
MATDTYMPHLVTGKYFRIRGDFGSGIGLHSDRMYCLDYNPITWNILGIWENKDECLKMYRNDPANNRIGGLEGLDMNVSCWDVLSEIYRNEHDKKSGQERHWFFRPEQRVK